MITSWHGQHYARNLAKICRAIFLLGIILISSSAVSAQVETATVSGVITDQSGGSVVGAEVRVTNADTNVTVTTSSSQSGVYLVTGLKPGRYRIHVAKDGFKGIDLTDLTLNVQDSVSRNFILQIGSASESISVEASALSINSTDAAVSTVIDRQFVKNLPLNGRSFNTLLQLTPGVVIAPTSGNPGQGQFSISGQRNDANSFSVDGVSANFGVGAGTNPQESGTGGAQALSVTGGTSSLVSVDALQEFRIETSSFAPEFGKTPGGQVILTTRSGTNAFHGGVFDYFRNTAMDANDWFANRAGNPRAPEHHNDFGGFLGGPIWKDKSFFFFSYEGARLGLPATAVNQVPSAFARSSAPAQLAPFLNAYPQPDDKTITPGVYTSQFTGTFSTRANLDATSVRIDHALNDRFSIFGRYNYAPSRTLQPGGGASISLSDLASTHVDTQTLTIGLNMMLRQRISNTLRGNYSSQDNNSSFSLNSFGGAVALSPSLLIGALAPAQNFGSFKAVDTVPLIVGLSGNNRTRQANFTDALAITAGSHQLQAGLDYRAIFLAEHPSMNNLVYSAPNIQTFLSTGSASLNSSARHPSDLLAPSLSLYAQDTWKVTPKLTLTYGVRWELSPAPSARGNTTLAAWQNTSDPASIALAPSGTPLWRTTYGNFAPRFGFAYRFTSNGDLVLRAGSGIFYDLGVGEAANFGELFPNTARLPGVQVSVPVPDVTPYLTTNFSRQPPFVSVFGFSNSLSLPRSYQWNVALEKSIVGKQAISVTYVGQAGRDLLRNEALLRPNVNFTGNFFLTGNTARSNYNALQFQFRRPLSSRLQALLNYTWSHSLDNASSDLVLFLPSNVISAENDYAASNFDVRHSFSGAITYDVPGLARSGILALLTNHWSFQSFIVVRTGFPLNATVSGTSPVGGTVKTRPDRVAGAPSWISNPAAPGGKALNTAAFSKPTTPRQGTEGRNDITGFGLTQLDLSIGRKFPITERLNLEFRTDAFNLPNHPNFSNPFGCIDFPSFVPCVQSGGMLNQALGGLNPLFQEGGPRSLQLALKINF